ncbi:MAG: threonine--tRNA ligase [Parcubacteria group bacterium]
MSSQEGSQDQIHKIRHSVSHLMATAVMEFFPKAKLGIGPVIENGFYYDFGLDRPLIELDLKKIEKRMKKLIAQNIAFVRKEVTSEEAKKLSSKQPYKLELISELIRDKKPLTYYVSEPFTDLCGGPHVQSTKEINPDAVKLISIAGAYWRGSEKNPMLQRIYGVAFETKEQLDGYLKQREEAAKRDHRRLGSELSLFSFSPVAPGAVFWHPHGMIIWNELEKLLRDMLREEGYDEVQTPLMVKPELFTQSGHLAHYKDNMFMAQNPQKEEFYLKPMNCPESTIIYASKKHSYRDLPIRLAEIGRIHRNELSGTLGGIFRVRQITQDDGHIYCRPDQLEAELTNVLKLSKKIYKIFGLKPSFYLSTKPDNAMGDPHLWQQAEAALTNALKSNKLAYKEKPKDGTFYAPKIDIDITDSLNRRWQLCTIQADLLMVPSLPGVEYTDEQGKTRKPMVIHRAIYGSFERFIGILTEHYAGAFPVWLSPIQVAIIPVGKSHNAFSRKLGKELAKVGVRTSVNEANETVGYKIRNAERKKVPYMLVIGDKEMKSSKLHVRLRGKKDIAVLAKKTFIARILSEIQKKK